MRESERERRARLRQRTERLRRRISALDYVASGTLHSRTKVCGRPNCRCATDPRARHGPYHEWSRRSEGRLVHRILTPSQAERIARAIANHQQLLQLVAQWEEETAAHILEDDADTKR